MAPVQFLAIGELLADMISAEYVTSLSSAYRFQLYPGGSPANVCANLQWMGVNAELVSCVGQDSIGDYLIDQLRQSGLHTEHIRRVRGYPTSMVLIGRSKGTPDFVAYRGADVQLEPVDTTFLRECSIIHTSAFALSRNPAQHNILEALSWAASQRKVISVDWNYAPSMWDSDGPMVFRQICSMHPLLKVSIDDMRRFLGTECSPFEAMAFLKDINADAVCLTCGKDGVWYRGRTTPEWTFCEAQVVNDVKDTTGAGDAFWSGFISAYLNKTPLQDCVLNGIAIATKKIQTVGPLFAVR